MRRHYFTIAYVLFLIVSLTSCSNDEVKTQSGQASRASAPVYANEVKIGSQIWMTKNLNVSRYRNGDLIPQVTDQQQWANLATGAWCYYDNNTANGVVYGKLYNWYAINDPRGLAPAGWHVPSDAEWTVLANFLGGSAEAGGKMKTIALWNSPNLAATNSSGFTGLPGGYRYYDGLFNFIGGQGYWWSSTENNTATYARYRYLFSGNGNLYSNYFRKQHGFSVRCVKD